MIYTVCLRAGTFRSIERLIVYSAQDCKLAMDDPVVASLPADSAFLLVQDSLNSNHSSESQKAFLTQISHELMSPLNNIMFNQEQILL